MIELTRLVVGCHSEGNVSQILYLGQSFLFYEM